MADLDIGTDGEPQIVWEACKSSKKATLFRWPGRELGCPPRRTSAVRTKLGDAIIEESNQRANIEKSLGGRLGADEAGDGFGGFLDLFLGFGATCFDGLSDAVAEVILDEAKGDGLQGPGHGGYLGEDVDAVGVGFHHALEPAHLTLDPAQPLEVSVLILRIPAHSPTVSAGRQPR